MNLVRRINAAVRHGLRHQWRHRTTALLLMLGLAAPVAIAVAVPLYSNAASARLFDEQLSAESATQDDLAFLFSYNRLNGGSRDWDDVVPLDDAFVGADAPEKLPLSSVDRFVETESFTLVAGDDLDSAERLGTVTLVSITNFDEHAVFVQGVPPEPAAAGAGTPDSPIEVAVSVVYADQESISVGQQLVLFDRAAASDADLRTISIVVTGLWTDDGEPNQFVGDDAFRKRLVVPFATITEAIGPRRDGLIKNVKWQLTLDRNGVNVDSVPVVLGASDRLIAQAEALLPGTRQLTNPSGALRTFQRQEAALRTGLRSFSLPLLALAGAVGILMINAALRTRAPEFSALRRRGIGRTSLLTAEAASAALITLGAVVPGLAIGFLVAAVIGRTRTFFRLTDSPGGGDFALAMNSEVWRSLFVAVLVLFATQLIAAAVATRRSARLDEGRDGTGSGAPWWQRTYLDVFAVLLIATLAWRGVRGESGRVALLDDPAIILLPAATAVAAGLLLLRAVPLLMRVVAALLERTDHIAALLAARRSARVPGDVAAPLLLLVITASLATFTASLAVTLDLQLLDSAHHNVGGTTSLVDEGSIGPDVDRDRVAAQEDVAVPPLVTSTTRHPELGDYARVWGIDRASATIELNGTGVHELGDIDELRFLGVEPATFAAVAFWRGDYGKTSLAELMRRLDATPNGVLVSGDTARGLTLGDELRLALGDEAGSAEFTGVVVGRFDQFPLWFPDRERPLVVGRAQLVEDLAGVTFDRRVLYEAGERFDEIARVDADLAAIGANSTLATTSVDAEIARAQTAPGRQGVLGMLTVGVALATVLTLAGFVITTVLAFRRRSTEMGVLRAMGMKRREVATLALFDLATVMLVGLAAAVALGLAMSRWFIPLLVDTPPGSAPELLPTVAWGAAGVITVLLLALLVLSALLVATTLRRVKVFESIRLGES